MNDSERYVAQTQRWLSFVFLIGFFGIMICQGLGILQISSFELLTQALMLILFFWFQRTRPPSTPEPGTQVTTTATNVPVKPAEPEVKP